MAKTDKITSGYLMRNLSPLHAGSGNSDYGVIDKLVQRDPNNNYPTIHSSSLKGALREYFEYQLPIAFNGDKSRAEKTVNGIFGYGNKSDRDRRNLRPEQTPPHHAGLFDFDGGHLLSIPVRTSKAAFVNATTFNILREFLERLQLFGATEKENMEKTLEPFLALDQAGQPFPVVFDEILNGAVLEEADIKAKLIEYTPPDTLKKLLGNRIAVLSEDQFEIIINNLPVIARNCLENGQSQNLWYEETVPRESRFYTLITKAVWRDEKEMDRFDASPYLQFDPCISASLIQVGANATVGYGKMQFTKFDDLLKNAKP